jgi:hypothetical protein
MQIPQIEPVSRSAFVFEKADPSVLIEGGGGRERGSEREWERERKLLTAMSIDCYVTSEWKTISLLLLLVLCDVWRSEFRSTIFMGPLIITWSAIMTTLWWHKFASNKVYGALFSRYVCPSVTHEALRKELNQALYVTFHGGGVQYRHWILLGKSPLRFRL